MVKTDINNGLASVDAQEILERDGYNELPSQRKQSSFSLLLKVLSEPMFLLLLGGIIIYTFLGELKDALVLLSSILVIISITFYQERKTERTLEALRKLSSPRALVIRDGEHKTIAGRDLVVGDIIILREGDRVPADAVIISRENLLIDESLLTGESLPVSKTEWDGKLELQRPGGEDLPFIFSGTLIVSGRGIAQVQKTGINTEMGKIGKSLDTIKDEDTLLHKETTKIVRTVATIALFLCIIVVIAYTLLKGNLIQGLLSGLTLGMAMLPEEFPVVLMIFLTLGAWRISKKNVLTRKAAAIETLGAATVLCTDKTGTLTLNQMQLSSLYTGKGLFEIEEKENAVLPEHVSNVIEFGILSSQEKPFDPIEKELFKSGKKLLKNSQYQQEDLTLVKEYHLSKELLAMSHVWDIKDQDAYLVASKGAPEAIIDLCHIDPDKRNDLLKVVADMSNKGLRVLGVAKAIIQKSNLPENQHDFDFEFIGFLGFIDPPRTTVIHAVKVAYDAGMRVIMITGDYHGTAQFIAKKVGIKNPELFLTGPDLEKMSSKELKEKVKTVNIFARVVPEQKLLIVNALKADKQIVAMTGDGVNDAPALKSAHIGISIGDGGTDVAREASSLVLLNNDFASVVSAVRLGRRIFNNLKKSMGYIVAVHVPIAGMSILPLLFNLPIVLLPVHIAFFELLIDPACSTVFESMKADSNIMKIPPRNLNYPILDRKTILISLLQGFGVFLPIFLIFLYSLNTGRSEIEARSIAFASLVLSNIALIITNLSWNKNIFKILLTANKTFYILISVTLLVLIGVLSIPFLLSIFYLTPLHLDDYLIVIAVVFVSIFWFEVFKLFKKF